MSNEHLSYRGYRGGYLSLGPNGTDEYHFQRYFNTDSGIPLSTSLASDIDMDLESFWTISGWVRGKGDQLWDNDFDIIRKCTEPDEEGTLTCYGLGIRDHKLCFVWQRFARNFNKIKFNTYFDKSEAF